MFAAVNHLVADGGFCTKHVSISKHMRSLKHVRTYIIITYIIIYIYLSHIFHYIAYYSILYITYCHILSTWLEHTGTYDVLWPCLKCSAVHATTAQCSTKELREGEVPIEIFQFIASKTSPLRMIPDGYFLWLIWKSNQRKSFKWSFNTYIIYICIYIYMYIYMYINIYLNVSSCDPRAESASTTLPRKGHVIREGRPQRGPPWRPNFSSAILRWKSDHKMGGIPSGKLT